MASPREESATGLDLMEPVLTTAAMRRADRVTIEDGGIPGRVLMENAGRAAVDLIERELGPARGRRVLVLCGKGNNGGDGLVIARVLSTLGADARAVVLGDEGVLTEDSRANLVALREETEVAVQLTDEPGDVDFAWPEWIVDALLGIGVEGPLRPPFDGMARNANRPDAVRISVDVPSGLNTDTGEAAEHCVEAHLTITLGALKPGLIVGDGLRCCGRLVTADIGIPEATLREAVARHGAGWRCTDEAFARLVPRRRPGAHKYTAGRVLVVAGSHAYPGAAALATRSAARAGAGAVVVGTPRSARPLVAGKLTEAMSFAVPETSDGTLGRDALDVLLERSGAADAVLIGPGLGKNDETWATVRELLARIDTPAVIDADGLNAIADEAGFLEQHGGRPWILTPHMGEMKRLPGSDAFGSEPTYAASAAWARQFECTLLMKGAPSLVASPEGTVMFAAHASPATATAGTGDVLAGVIAGLMAQGLGPVPAGVAGLHLTGRAVRAYESAFAAQTMVASDIIERLPEAFPR